MFFFISSLILQDRISPVVAARIKNLFITLLNLLNTAETKLDDKTDHNDGRRQAKGGNYNDELGDDSEGSDNEGEEEYDSDDFDSEDSEQDLDILQTKSVVYLLLSG